MTNMPENVNFELLSLTAQLELIEDKYTDNILKRKKTIEEIDQCILKFEEILLKNNVDGAYFYIVDEHPFTTHSKQFPVQDSGWITTMIFYGNRDQNSEKKLEYKVFMTDDQITEFSYEKWYMQVTAQQMSGGRIAYFIDEAPAAKYQNYAFLSDFMEQILEAFSDYKRTGIQVFRPTVILDEQK